MDISSFLRQGIHTYVVIVRASGCALGIVEIYWLQRASQETKNKIYNQPNFSPSKTHTL